ncbi:hypothetical protein LO771_23720 [Streptacidiphilus sp. ASG 303]|uniref:DUF3592 domain-containing protein n=1 Tax=Streptacidiphilus sp. ASG 303 TaxID=2896847 RepID=UPI001E652EDE|nr:DUF3592 domain-containing protein [Streptacidiphilus sp. ASG 303]MCD0485311.1 hypothetical protein [Streptacidiphilus sp. ASG 303]
MRSESLPRIGRGWYATAVLSAVLALGMGVLGLRQLDQADRIAADPVKVRGTVTRLASGTGTYSQVSYRAGGRTLAAADLRLPAGAAVGDPVCLEYAKADPAAVRVCGQRYPQAAGIGLAQTSVPVGVGLLVVCLLRIRRHRRALALRRGPARSAVRATAVFAAEGVAPAAPRASRRRRRGGRRARR